MSAPGNIRMLTRYAAWANTRLVEAMASLPEGQATAQRATGFGNMANTLNHAYVVDLIWKAHLEDKPLRTAADHEPARVPARCSTRFLNAACLPNRAICGFQRDYFTAWPGHCYFHDKAQRN
ncbi:DinB family protein [Polaromonas sp.]|uniref:DinB family protein n=1 Tax=Polaromonas sp. TaxID=1869339 RepID=UPI0032654114